jgi:hypothetical protein
MWCPCWCPPGGVAARCSPPPAAAAPASAAVFRVRPSFGDIWTLGHRWAPSRSASNPRQTPAQPNWRGAGRAAELGAGVVDGEKGHTHAMGHHQWNGCRLRSWLDVSSRRDAGAVANQRTRKRVRRVISATLLAQHTLDNDAQACRQARHLGVSSHVTAHARCATAWRCTQPTPATAAGKRSRRAGPRAYTRRNTSCATALVSAVLLSAQWTHRRPPR